MHLKMLVGLAGPAFVLEPGDLREFPDAEAARLVAAGYAVPVVPDRVERAVRPAPVERRKKHVVSGDR